MSRNVQGVAWLPKTKQSAKWRPDAIRFSFAFIIVDWFLRWIAWNRKLLSVLKRKKRIKEKTQCDSQQRYSGNSFHHCIEPLVVLLKPFWINSKLRYAIFICTFNRRILSIFISSIFAISGFLEMSINQSINLEINQSIIQ